jgi:hypothetical protein
MAFNAGAARGPGKPPAWREPRAGRHSFPALLPVTLSMGHARASQAVNGPPRVGLVHTKYRLEVH